MLRRCRDAAAARRSGKRADDGSALLFVLMAIMISSSLSILLLGMVMTQVKPTLSAQKATRTVHAAEAGIEAALARIRSATTANSNGVQTGDRAKLPCTPTTAADVNAATSSGRVKYEVTVTYYVEDPTEQSSAWRTANKMACQAGTGPHLSGVPTTPGYALLQATGSGDSGPGVAASSANREMESIYAFKWTNPNVPGGLIHNLINFTTQGNSCFAAASIAANAQIKMITCDPAAVNQRFSYLTDYTILLNASKTVSTPNGLCIRWVSGGQPLILETCSASANQKWGLDDFAHFRHLDDCINYATVTLKADSTGCTAGGAKQYSLSPEPTVGAGNAGPNQQQLVNYQEFGRCLDVTGWDIDTDYLIAYACKQDPYAPPLWNQRFTYTAGALGEVRVKSSYCLTAPSISANPAYVTAKTCNGSASQKWTVNERTTTYVTGWTVVNSNGKCLSLGDPYGASESSTIIMETCSDSLEQKWNAPPNVTDAINKDYRETVG